MASIIKTNTNCCGYPQIMQRIFRYKKLYYLRAMYFRPPADANSVSNDRDRNNSNQTLYQSINSLYDHSRYIVLLTAKKSFFNSKLFIIIVRDRLRME